MNNLNSLIAFFSPWLFGSMTLYASLNLTGNSNRYPYPFYAGYGFFLGYLALTLLLRLTDWLGFGLHDSIVLSSLLIIPLLLSLLCLPAIKVKTQSVVKHWRISNCIPQSDYRIIIISVSLLVAIISHLIFIGTEILWRPMYPWDAWTTWAVKAKILAHEAKLVAFIPVQEWLQGNIHDAYPLPAHDYPLFVPLIQVWIALSLGHWSDTLVNLPWLGCGIALVLIFYAQGQIVGLNRVISLLLAYLLISLPMLNTHIALAGYADIWQAAYSSSALLALINWRLRADKTQLLLGLLMAFAGLAIKIEGQVWLLLTLIFILLITLSRHQLLGLLITLTFISFISWLADGWVVRPPGLGEIGVKNNQLYLGSLGSFSLHFTNVLKPVTQALFQYQSWHLFWYWMVATLLIAAVPPYPTEKKLFISLFGLVAMAIFIIFFLSDSALWAQNQTSLNRLLLHFVPALLYAAFMTWIAQFKLAETHDESLRISTNP